MPKRMFLILMLLIALALACTRRASIPPEPPTLIPATFAPAVSAETATPTGGEVFLPEVSTGADQTQAAVETAVPQATAVPGTTEAVEQPEDTAATTEAGPLPTEAPQVAATQPVANTVYLPVVGAGREGEPGEAGGGGSQTGGGPSISLEANPVTLRVGETLTVVGRPVGIGLPYYDLTVQDQGAQQAQALGRVTYENETQPQPGVSQVLELVSAEGSMYQATFVLRAKAPGTAAVQITATGEVQADSGAYMWSGGSSQAIAVTVSGE